MTDQQPRDRNGALLEDRIDRIDRALVAAGLTSAPGETRIVLPSAVTVSALRLLMVELFRMSGPERCKQLASDYRAMALEASKKVPAGNWAERNEVDAMEEMAAMAMEAAAPAA